MEVFGLQDKFSDHRGSLSLTGTFLKLICYQLQLLWFDSRTNELIFYCVLFARFCSWEHIWLEFGLKLPWYDSRTKCLSWVDLDYFEELADYFDIETPDDAILFWLSSWSKVRICLMCVHANVSGRKTWMAFNEICNEASWVWFTGTPLTVLSICVKIRMRSHECSENLCKASNENCCAALRAKDVDFFYFYV